MSKAAELAKLGPTFEALGEQWLDGVERGHIGRRRGRGKAYSDTTIEGMRRSWRYRLLPEFGPRIAEEITEIDWQRGIDELARRGAVPLDDRKARLRRLRHLRLSLGAVSAPRPSEPFAPRRAAAERREAAAPRGARARSCSPAGGRWSRRIVSPTRSRSTRVSGAARS